MKTPTPSSIRKNRSFRDIRVALVAARFNPKICNNLIAGAQKALREAGLSASQIDLFRVPGSFELPLAAKKCALSGVYQGVISLGAVIRGETPHFNYICQAASFGITQVSLETGVPIAFGVITANSLDQALARSRKDRYNKGRGAALAVLEMIRSLEKMQ